MVLSFHPSGSAPGAPGLSLFQFLALSEPARQELEWSGASWSETTPYGETLLDCAIRHRRTQTALFFLSQGADPFFDSPRRDQEGFRLRARPFEAALERGLWEFAQAVLDTLDAPELERRENQWRFEMSFQLRSGCAARSTPGCSWAHLAAGPDARCARALRLAGVSAAKLDNAHRSPLLSCALNLGSRACAAELLLAGADPFCSDRSGSSALGRMPEDWLSAGVELERVEIGAGLREANAPDFSERPRAWL